MKALMLTGPRELAVIEMAAPEIGHEEVRIRVSACGICGSDVHGYDLSSGRRIPPLVMGHEAAGMIDAVGPAVTGFEPGDRVVFDSTIYCGKCEHCQDGRSNLCERREVVGVSAEGFRRHGAFAEFVSVPARVCHRLPTEVPIEHAAMVEALSVALHAVARAPLSDTSTAVVIGAGVIGGLVVQVLRARGVTEVVAVDRDASRLEMVSQTGATETIDITERPALEAVLELTGGRGATHTYEAVGTPAALKSAIDCVARGGHVTLIGNVTPQADFPLQSVVAREITLHGSAASSGEYVEAIELMRTGRVDVGPFISALAPLEEGADWFDRLYRREPGLMKVVLTP